MKRLVLNYLIIAALAAFLSCNKGQSNDDINASITITMTTAKTSNVTIGMLGSGTFTIDWGDGSAIETHTFPLSKIRITPYHYYTHSYSDVFSRTVIITGEDITYFDCSANQLTSLGVSKNTTLTNLICSDNQLTSLKVSNITALAHLYCSGNQLKNLDISENIALTDLSCGMNQLTDLDVSKNSALTTLSCGNNPLKSLDVSNNSALTNLDCSDNQLKSIDVSKNSVLTHLSCSDNQLTSLDVSNNTELKFLFLRNNQLISSALNVLFETLPLYSSEGFYWIFIGENLGADTCDKSLAENKRWTVWD